MSTFGRRQFLHLAGVGGIVFASRLAGVAQAAEAQQANRNDFYFLQMSDTHWGFDGPPNPDSHGTLPKAIDTINAFADKPDFIIFTGDLTHTTDDPNERRKRMGEFRDIVSKLDVKTVRFIPGEHDAALDNGKAYQEFFGSMNYTFDHNGVHFIVLDNVSDPGAKIGDTQLAWLADDLKTQRTDAPIVVFTHRPLFDLYPQWDWATRDGAKAVELLMPYQNVTVFYGHIHQEHHQMTGHIAHHSAKSLIFAQPAPGSTPKRTPVAWDAAHPYAGLGFREIGAQPTKGTYTIAEMGVNQDKG